jgi:hypothetical protein
MRTPGIAIAGTHSEAGKTKVCAAVSACTAAAASGRKDMRTAPRWRGMYTYTSDPCLSSRRGLSRGAGISATYTN